MSGSPEMGEVMKRLSIAILILVSSRAFALDDGKCFTDLAGYEALKSELPAFLQKNPFYSVCKNCGSMNAMSIKIEEKGITVDGSFMGGRDDRGPISKICLNEGRVDFHRHRSVIRATPEGDGYRVKNSIMGDFVFKMTAEAEFKKYQQHDGFFAPQGYGDPPARGGNGNR